MITDLFSATALVASGAFGLGVALALVVARARLAVRVQAAIAQAEGDRRAQIATLEERLVSLKEEVEREREEVLDLKDESDELRAELDDVRTERAKLAERASRVEALERERSTLSKKLEDANLEMLERASGEAKTRQALDSVSKSLAEVEAERDRHEDQLRLAGRDLADLRERSGKVSAQFDAEREAHAGTQQALEGERARCATAQELVSKLLLAPM